ncbi:type II pantothenate kinase [Niallia sp. 03133]|uniref:type II pantothenate kinase n=1 Tax=Niallia sp. 03133 TaxID=3458060 RepID=UPI0040444866
MAKKIGIDAGGSLIKLAYYENGQFHNKKYSVSEIDSVLNWLKMMQVEKVGLTGGRAEWIKDKFFPSATITHEFNAVRLGTNWLLKDMGVHVTENYLLVQIGTGTSWYFVNGEKSERILGSGIGGGTWLGLGALLTKEKEFAGLVDLAVKGNRQNVDLLVRDIYTIENPLLNGDLTASNFAKIDGVNDEKDLAASLLQMIGETIFLLTKQAANLNKPAYIVYAGTTISENKPLQNILSSFGEQLGVEQLFLEKGEYSGAISALLSLD